MRYDIMSPSTPSRPMADRNLLFGILALQMDFIGRDALIAAMNAWVVDKTKPLGQILLERGTLRSDTHDLLDAVVQKHLELHGGDAEKSLASVSSIGSVRQDLEQIVDADLHASLAHVSAARPAELDPYATQPPAAGTPTSAGLRFHILRPHAKGGLGEVFVARDAELHREVALKEIQNRYADDDGDRAGTPAQRRPGLRAGHGFAGRGTSGIIRKGRRPATRRADRSTRETCVPPGHPFRSATPGGFEVTQSASDGYVSEIQPRSVRYRERGRGDGNV
jgi:hypothetical protein